jgi:hypothetical protein
VKFFIFLFHLLPLDSVKSDRAAAKNVAGKIELENASREK